MMIHTSRSLPHLPALGIALALFGITGGCSSESSSATKDDGNAGGGNSIAATDDGDAGGDAGDAGGGADNSSSSGDASSGDDSGCAPGELSCDGACAPCPTVSGTAIHVCESGACMASTCAEGYLRCPAGCCSWNIEIVAAPPNERKVELVVDGADVPHLLYVDGNTNFVEATNPSGIWITNIITTGSREADSFAAAVDSNDTLHLGIFNWNDGAVDYATNAGGSWKVSLAATGFQTGFGVDIAVDTQDTPHISFYDTQPSAMRYGVLHNGRWSLETFTAVQDLPARLALDSSDTPHILRGLGTLTLSVKQGDSWVDSSVPSMFGLVQAAEFDASDRLHGLLGGAYDLTYGVYDNGTWSTEIIDSTNNAGRWGDMSLDSQGRPHMVYCDSCADQSGPNYYYDDLAYNWSDGIRWYPAIIDDVDYVFLARMDVDSLGRAHVIYISRPPINSPSNGDENTIYYALLQPAD